MPECLRESRRMSRLGQFFLIFAFSIYSPFDTKVADKVIIGRFRLVGAEATHDLKKLVREADAGKGPDAVLVFIDRDGATREVGAEKVGHDSKVCQDDFGL